MTLLEEEKKAVRFAHWNPHEVSFSVLQFFTEYSGSEIVSKIPRVRNTKTFRNMFWPPSLSKNEGQLCELLILKIILNSTTIINSSGPRKNEIADGPLTPSPPKTPSYFGLLTVEIFLNDSLVVVMIKDFDCKIVWRSTWIAHSNFCTDKVRERCIFLQKVYDILICFGGNFQGFWF